MKFITSLLMEWREASLYANNLIEESSWSRTVYSYTKAAMLLQLDDQISSAERQQCIDLMRYTYFLLYFYRIINLIISYRLVSLLLINYQIKTLTDNYLKTVVRFL